MNEKRLKGVKLNWVEPRLPRGFSLSTTHAGFKTTGGEDLVLLVSEETSGLAGLFTRNQVQAAPVSWSKSCLKKLTAKKSKLSRLAVLINAGNANACTGKPGALTVSLASKLVGQLLGIKAEQVLAASTGVIGVPLPREPLLAGIQRLVPALDNAAKHLQAAATAIMTTDTRPKLHTAEISLHVGKEIKHYTVTGLAKGSGMIHPQLATMLGFILTDAPLTNSECSEILTAATAESLQAVSIDGDTSTNDSVFLVASNPDSSSAKLPASFKEGVRQAIKLVCQKLARDIALDGEGVSKIFNVVVTGAATKVAAKQVAETIATSLLVKTAAHGGDANWGRILAAAGRAYVPLKLERLTLKIGKHLVFAKGESVPAGQKGAKLHMQEKELTFALDLGSGKQQATVLSTDLTADYVKINAHYLT